MSSYNLLDLQEVLDYHFKNPKLLAMALTHDSFCNEHALPSYERLEFLGDSVLGMVVACYLHDKYPNENEGFLTKAKAKIVSTQSLSAAIGRLNVMPFIRVGNSGNAQDIRNSKKVREDVFEAIVGAIFLDGGLKECKRFILRELNGVLNESFTYDSLTDPKSRLLEIAAQTKRKVIFKDVPSVLDGGNPGYEVSVIVDGETLGVGYGVNKKKADQKASERALKSLGILK